MVWQKKVHKCMRTFKKRLWDFNFIFKLFAWVLNKLCLYVWSEGVKMNSLPAFNGHQLAFLYVTLPAYNIIFTCLILLYLANEVPPVMTQRVFLIGGFTLYIVTGALGIANCIDNDFPPIVMVMSLLCLTNATVIIFDYIKIENFFIPNRRILAQVQEQDPQTYRQYVDDQPSTTTID